jgi:hypothetical protein
MNDCRETRHAPRFRMPAERSRANQQPARHGHHTRTPLDHDRDAAAALFLGREVEVRHERVLAEKFRQCPPQLSGAVAVHQAHRPLLGDEGLVEEALGARAPRRPCSRSTFSSPSSPSRGCRVTCTRTAGGRSAGCGLPPDDLQVLDLRPHPLAAHVDFRLTTRSRRPRRPRGRSPPTATRSPGCAGRRGLRGRLRLLASRPSRTRSATSAMAAWACSRAAPASPVVRRGVPGCRPTRSTSTDVRLFRSATTASISRRASRTRSSMRSCSRRRSCSSRSRRAVSRRRNGLRGLQGLALPASAARSRSSRRTSSSTRARWSCSCASRPLTCCRAAAMRVEGRPEREATSRARLRPGVP